MTSFHFSKIETLSSLLRGNPHSYLWVGFTSITSTSLWHCDQTLWAWVSKLSRLLCKSVYARATVRCGLCCYHWNEMPSQLEMAAGSHMNKSDLYSIDLSWPENLNGFKDASRIFSEKFRQLMLPGSVYRIFHIFSWKRLWFIIVANNNKKLSFSFVSLCSHVWCRSRRFDCILLVFFRRWGRLVMRDLIKHDALQWSIVFNSSDWCISILADHSVICSLGGPLSHGSPVVAFLDRGHPRFWNFYSTIPVDVVRVKSYMNWASLTLRV